MEYGKLLFHHKSVGLALVPCLPVKKVAFNSDVQSTTVAVNMDPAIKLPFSPDTSAQVVLCSALLLPICIGLYTESPVCLCTLPQKGSLCVPVLNYSTVPCCSGFGNDPHLSTYNMRT